MDKTKRSEIMGRIEDMRHDLKMGKSKFCAAFGVKPQTYNNFTGKPTTTSPAHRAASPTSNC